MCSSVFSWQRNDTTKSSSLRNGVVCLNLVPFSIYYALFMYHERIWPRITLNGTSSVIWHHTMSSAVACGCASRSRYVIMRRSFFRATLCITGRLHSTIIGPTSRADQSRPVSHAMRPTAWSTSPAAVTHDSRPLMCCRMIIDNKLHNRWISSFEPHRRYAEAADTARKINLAVKRTPSAHTVMCLLIQGLEYCAENRRSLGYTAGVSMCPWFDWDMVYFVYRSSAWNWDPDTSETIKVIQMCLAYIYD